MNAAVAFAGASGARPELFAMSEASECGYAATDYGDFEDRRERCMHFVMDDDSIGEHEAEPCESPEAMAAFIAEAKAKLKDLESSWASSACDAPALRR